MSIHYPLKLPISKNDLAFLALLFILHLAFFFSTGLNECRYSLNEDHEILTAVAKIKQNGIIATFNEQMQYETRGRFRPLFIVYRIGTCALFGDNIQKQHFFFYAVFILSTMLLFLWGREFGFPPWLSFIFTLLVFTGFHTSIGWRLANGENIALLLLNTGLLCFLRGLNRSQWRLCFIAGVLILMAAFSKESFIACFGFLPLLYLSRFNNSQIPWKRFWQLSAIATACVGLYALNIRFFIIHPDSMKYAGSTITVKDIMELQFGMFEIYHYALNIPRIWQTFIFHGSYFQPYILLMVLVSICALIWTPSRKAILISISIVSALLIFHKFLYLRVILFNIYLYPGIVVIGFFIICLVNKLFYSKKIVGGTMVLLILFVVLNQGRASYEYAHAFYYENLAAVSVTDTLIANCQNRSIYIQADPLLHVEFAYGLKTRLQLAGCPKSVFYSLKEEGDSTEALSIMKFTDPSIVPFMRQQFKNQFSKKITDKNPETNLNGDNIWIILQRPEKSTPVFREVNENVYTQYTYEAPGFYKINTLLPNLRTENSRKNLEYYH